MDSNNNKPDNNSSLTKKSTTFSNKIQHSSSMSDDENNNNIHYTISTNLEVPNSFENEDSRASYVSTILGEDPLSQQLKEAIECTKCFHLSSGQVFQDRQFNLYCDDCVPSDNDDNDIIDTDEETEVPKYCRNIAIEKVINELLEPHLKTNPPKNKRIRTQTEPSEQNSSDIQTVPKIDNEVNMRRASQFSISDFSNRPSLVSTNSQYDNNHNNPNSEPIKRPRCYTMPQNIVNAIAEYEKHKQELSSRVVRWLQCSVCLESTRPQVIDQIQPELAKKFQMMRKQKWKNKKKNKTNDVAPLLPVLQCRNGHLICGQCSAKLMADNNLRNVDTCCPFCRIEITEQSMIRNLAVEKILTLLPVECGTCLTKKPIEAILNHEQNECPEQKIDCIYKILGCEFSGKRSNLQAHLDNSCLYHNRPAKLLQNEIKNYVTEKIENYKNHEKTLKLFSRKLAFVDFQLNSQRTDEYVSRLFLKSGNISALGHTFCVKVWPSGIDPMYPTRNPDRHLEYQICLKGLDSRVRDDRGFILEVSHLLVTPPIGNYDISGETHVDKLSSSRREGRRYRLNMDAHEVNLVLAKNEVTLRLFLFLN